MDRKLGGLSSPVLALVAALAGCSGQDRPPSADAAPDQSTMSAAPVPAKVASADDLAICKSWSDIAGSIMRGRQTGGTMAQMMALPNNESQTSKSEGEHLIMAAFDKPRMAVKENQDAMVTDFQNETYLDCMKSKNL